MQKQQKQLFYAKATKATFLCKSNKSNFFMQKQQKQLFYAKATKATFFLQKQQAGFGGKDIKHNKQQAQTSKQTNNQAMKIKLSDGSESTEKDSVEGEKEKDKDSTKEVVIDYGKDFIDYDDLTLEKIMYNFTLKEIIPTTLKKTR